MSNYKNKLPKSFYNIIILLLILIVLFSMAKLIFDKKSLNNDSDGIHQREIFKLDKNSKISDDFFIKIVQHIFPNKTVQKQYKPIFSFKGAGKSFFISVFKIDFNNPITFIQAQFPVATIHNDALAANIPQNDNQMEEDWSKEIHFVDYDEDEKNKLANKNIDTENDKAKSVDSRSVEDIEKITENEENIIDSLGSITIDDLSNIQIPKSIKIEEDKPSILIYHTHGTESYKPMSEGNYHSLKKEYTVIETANVITNELEKKGYSVIHDITYHDYPSYNGSYGRSATTAKSILEKNPSIKIILDVHRDGYDKIDTRADKLKLIENSRVKIDDEYVARFQFVIGATSENRKEVEKFARFVKAVSDKKYPGFSKDILVKQYGSYNQYLSDYSALIELGSNANTIEEAKRASYYLADVIADALDILCK